MDQKYVNLSDIIGSDSEPDDKVYNIYQLHGSYNRPGCMIKLVGFHDRTPSVSITKFQLGNYMCEVISYLLSDADIKLSQLYLLGLLIKSDDQVKATITYTFIPSNIDVSTLDDDKLEELVKAHTIIEGHFAYYLEYKAPDGSIVKKLLEDNRTYPGDSQLVYEIIELLSHDNLCFLF